MSHATGERENDNKGASGAEPGPPYYVTREEELVPFPTYSDLSWSILRRVMAEHAAKIGM